MRGDAHRVGRDLTLGPASFRRGRSQCGSRWHGGSGSHEIFGAGPLVSEGHAYLNAIGRQSTKAKGIPFASISQLSGKTWGNM